METYDLMASSDTNVNSGFYQVPRDNFAARLESEIPHLLRRAGALTRDELLAGDLVQDCLVRALSKKHLWQEGTNLRAWLFTLLRNLLIDNRRRVAGEGINVALNEDDPSLGAVPTQDSKLELRDLNHALTQLPEEMRTVILLVCLDGLRYGAVAKILDIPFGTVCSRLHRGREELRRLMGYAADRPTWESQPKPDTKSQAFAAETPPATT